MPPMLKSPPTRLALAVLASCLLLTPPAARAADAEPPPPYSTLLASEKALFAALDRAIPALLATAEIPGLQIAVVGPAGLAWRGAYGVRSAAGGEAVTHDTVFEAASLSKPIVAYAALRLADRGALDLDAPLAALVDEPRITHDPRGRRITARHVLTHSTGLPNWGGDRLSLAFEPGAGFGYSGEGFVWLQKVLERTTGLPLDALARREVFAPLGMERSAYVWQGAFADDVATGHFRLGRSRPIDRQGDANAAGSLLTTASDYARFLVAVAGGEGLAEETWTAALAPASRPEGTEWGGEPFTPERRGLVAWGQGWGLYQRPHGAGILWHWGDNGAFRAFTAIDRATGAGVVYLTNSEHGLSVLEALVPRIVGPLRPVRAWLDYPQHDDPRQVALRELRGVFADSGVDAGRQRLVHWLGGGSSTIDAGLLTQLAEDLDELGHGEEAGAVLTTAVVFAPESSETWGALGGWHAAHGEAAEAVAALGRAVALDPEDETLARGLAWARELERVGEAPVTLGAEALARFAGTYGARTLRIEAGALVYQRTGRDPYRLVPVTPDTFALEGMADFRLRVETDAEGRPTALLGLYLDGTTDRSERDEND